MFVNQGYGLMSIAYRLNQQGVKTRRGSTWENRSIKYIIQNPVYIGKIRWNYATHNGKPGTVSINDEADWIIVDGTHEPIIDDETFKKAQEKIAQFKSRPRGVSHRSIGCPVFWSVVNAVPAWLITVKMRKTHRSILCVSEQDARQMPRTKHQG